MHEDCRNIRDWVKRAALILEEAGLEDSRYEARLLVSETLAIDLQEQYKQAEREFTATEVRKLEQNLQRRARREPFSSIFHKAYFYGQEFLLNAACLAPRPETELLVETAWNLFCDSNWESEHSRSAMALEQTIAICELCCGSGAPGLALLYELTRAGWPVHLTLSDISNSALQAARKNAENLGLLEQCSFVQADLLPPLTSARGFAMILVNPPYIPTRDLEHLMTEVKDYEPRLALDGGEDGLDYYRRLARGVPAYLLQGGWLLMEHGHTQADRVRSIFATDWLGRSFSVKDYAGHSRVLAWQHS